MKSLISYQLIAVLFLISCKNLNNSGTTSHENHTNSKEDNNSEMDHEKHTYPLLTGKVESIKPSPLNLNLSLMKINNEELHVLNNIETISPNKEITYYKSMYKITLNDRDTLIPIFINLPKDLNNSANKSNYSIFTAGKYGCYNISLNQILKESIFYDNTNSQVHLLKMLMNVHSVPTNYLQDQFYLLKNGDLAKINQILQISNISIGSEKVPDTLVYKYLNGSILKDSTLLVHKHISVKVDF